MAKEARSEARRSARGRFGDAAHVQRLETLGAFLDLELDRLVLEELLAPLALDLRVVDEDVRTIGLLDEPETFVVVKALHLTDGHLEPPLLLPFSLTARR